VSNTTSPWGQAVTSTAPEAASAAPELTPSRPLYDGKLAELYAIYLRHLVLMLLTLGWSRFWGRTRIRRYLWNHFAVLGDRFEYRGRGRELLIGFLLAVLMLAVWGGLMWLVWIYVFHEKPFANFGLFDIFWLSVALIGFPLAYVGQYAGLRYRLSRTRWRGIRCALLFECEHLAERADRDLDLVERRLARREPLDEIPLTTRAQALRSTSCSAPSFLGASRGRPSCGRCSPPMSRPSSASMCSITTTSCSIGRR